MSNNLHQAYHQWRSRPADERFFTIREGLAAADRYRREARTSQVRSDDLKIVDSDGDVALLGASGKQASFSNFAFGQFAARCQAPANYLRSLPAPLAAECLNTSLQNTAPEEMMLLLRENGGLSIRCATSPSYGRIWDNEILQEIEDRLIPLGWKVPPARPAFPDQPGTRVATAEDCPSISLVQPGDLIAPAGVYISDHDMFAAMVLEDKTITAPSGHALHRGFMIANSEVGNRALDAYLFYFDKICSNHIYWNVNDLVHLRIIHRKNAPARFEENFVAEISSYANASAFNDQAAINNAATVKLGNDKQEVINLLFGKKILPRKQLEAAYDFAVLEAEEHNAGDPNTVWGQVSGLSRYSQTLDFADARVEVDRAAGKVLQMAF